MYSEKSGVIFKNDDRSNAILEMELMMFKTEEQDMSSPKVSTIIIIITGEPEGDDLEIVWDAIPFETTTNQSADSGIFRCQIQLRLWTRW